MTYFSTDTVCKTLEFPCCEKLTPEVMEKFNFDKKSAVERYMDLLRLIAKCETRIDFENAMMIKYKSQVKLAMDYAKKVFGEDFPPY